MTDATHLTQDELKTLVGRAALQYVTPGEILGVGTGSTVNCFIDALADMKARIPGAVSSSEASSARLRTLGIAVLDANEVQRLSVYIDGADEIDGHGCMIKGGGAALTREKIVAALADRFICIADASKRVDVLGRFPLPVEVIPMAAAQLTRRFAALGGTATLRLKDGAARHRQRPAHPGRAGPRHYRSAGVRDGRQPVAGRGHGGCVRASARECLPARNPRGGPDHRLRAMTSLPRYWRQQATPSGGTRLVYAVPSW